MTCLNINIRHISDTICRLKPDNGISFYEKKNSVLIIRIFIACKDLQTPKIIRFLAHINTCTIYCKYHNSFARKISIYYCNRTRKRKRTVVPSSRNVALFILNIAVILNSYIPCTIQFTSMLITYS